MRNEYFNNNVLSLTRYGYLEILGPVGGGDGMRIGECAKTNNAEHTHFVPKTQYPILRRRKRVPK